MTYLLEFHFSKPEYQIRDIIQPMWMQDEAYLGHTNTDIHSW